MKEPKIYNDVDTITFAYRELRVIATRKQCNVFWNNKEIKHYPATDKNEAVNQRFGMGMALYDLISESEPKL